MADYRSYEELVKRGAPPKWWEPRLPRAVFRDLMKRNNYRAFLSHGLYFVILAAVGYLSAALYVRGSRWCILAFFAYGTLFGMCNSRVHESLHGTPFRTVFWNEIVYFLTSAMEIRCALTTRWSHMIHHSYTIITNTDLEILAPRPAKMWKLVLDFFYLNSVIFFLLPMLSAAENVSLPLLEAGNSRAERERRLREVLDYVGLGGRARHKPGQLSGGEQQRVAIARALVNRPEVLLADEPTGELDEATGNQIASLLERLNADGTAIVLVTHNPELASRAHRPLHMRDGRLLEGEP